MSTLRVATYSVRADVQTSARWQRHAAAEGFPSVGAWLAVVAERYLKLRNRPVPLHWSPGRFTVAFEHGEAEVSGLISAPFATFRGTAAGQKVGGRSVHTLVHLPTGRILATVSYRRDARALALELAREWRLASTPS